MQSSQEHLKAMVYAKFGGQTECIMGNWKIENLETRKTFGYENDLRGIQRCFLQRSPKYPVLKVIQCRRIFEDFSSTFFTLWSRKTTFLKGNLCMYKCFTNVYKFFHRR